MAQTNTFVQRLAQAFKDQFGDVPSAFARAPGRVNLIGDHTDYNHGFALPMAIDCQVAVAFRPRQDRRVVVHSLAFDETVEIRLDDVTRASQSWREYVKAAAWALSSEHRNLRGFDGVLDGDLPVASGLSSSAALELAVLRTLCRVNDIPWSPRQMALLAQHAENAFVGVRCGAMDQLVSSLGQRGHAVLLDFDTDDMEVVPLPTNARVVILDTSTPRSLASSGYNERRTQCESVCSTLAVGSLRRVDLSQLEANRTRLAETAYRRARHVLSENERTLRAAEALREGDSRAFGCLMSESHASLRDDYEVSTAELDAMVDIATAHPACFGARMTGAGFGGCAVALVQAEAAEDVAAVAQHQYRARTGRDARVIVCNAADGASVERLAFGAS